MYYAIGDTIEVEDITESNTGKIEKFVYHPRYGTTAIVSYEGQVNKWLLFDSKKYTLVSYSTRVSYGILSLFFRYIPLIKLYDSIEELISQLNKELEIKVI